VDIAIHRLRSRINVPLIGTIVGIPGDIDDSLLSKMARQCGITRRQFLCLVDCPLQRPEYEERLIKVGKL